MSLRNCGESIVVRNIAQAMSERGMDCAIWGLSGPQAGVQLPAHLPYRSLDLPTATCSRPTTRRLREALARERPDILHLHSFTAHVHGVRAARELGLRTVVSFHDFRLGARRAWVCHHLAPAIDRMVLLSDTMRAFFTRECRYPAAKLAVLPNAVDTGYFAPGERDEALAQRWGLSPEDYVIGAVGQLNHVKGQRFLVEAFGRVARELPAARLVLVGEGPYRARLEAQARRLRLEDRIVFTGWHGEIKSWLSVFNLYVQPSLIEGHGLAINEAMAMALPIVSADRGSPQELLANGEAGVLIPPARPRELAEAILSLAHDPVRARTLGQAAREQAVRKYSLSDYGEHLWELYQPLLNGHRRG
jgi:glycosyltransferase involved in cell wall biosynthesis